MSAPTKLAISYAIFALIATAANIGIQVLVIHIYQGVFAILASIIAGTGVGLIVKYILDKRYIFRFHARNIAHNTRTFVLYSAMGLATTLIFWGAELCFQYAFESDEMRYLGGVIGLAIGYLTKYQLDKRYVFRTEDA
ncbi:GtrA family protein [Pseudochelatococcus contaminans]|uniref:Putative flippase GtrA n=1 Tax=Pseudochelatococcus contaminans TaxID=1538103 RepID=A0A7W5Z2G9_9HYPH|nr:GtrA family protein [Pseudochelatococcus contaminans]MBB3808900.1 putative flippase GtrA [Pseudochelatococcus contaminans]